MKESEKLISEQRTTQSRSSHSPKLMLWLIPFVSLLYFLYTLNLLSTSTACSHAPLSIHCALLHNATFNNASASSILRRHHRKTELRHVVFGIAASAKLWEQRKNYIRLWYKAKEMRAVVWLDDVVKTDPAEGLPLVRISTDTSNFPYTNKQGHRSALRISRIVSETMRLGMKDVRWFVMGDDDTVFVTDILCGNGDSGSVLSHYSSSTASSPHRFNRR